jgi:homoserine trans-succinylase
MENQMETGITVQKKLTQIIEILGNTVEKTMDVCIALLVKIEYEHRPDHYSNSNYRNGINTLDFIYDILNYLSGYHDLDPYFT